MNDEQQLIQRDGLVRYYPCFTPNDEAWFDRLNEEIQWRQDTIHLFGKTHPLPRLQAWYGDAHAQYKYSNISLNPLPWTPGLLELKTMLETQLQTQFHGVLCNYYRDGRDYAAWHSDDEKVLGPRPTIASLSFGEQRRFQLRHKSDGEQKEILLDSGSLLVMEGILQECWKHQLPKSLKVKRPRLNLTFRPLPKFF